MKLSTMVLSGVVVAGLAATSLFAAEDNVRPGRAHQGPGYRGRYAQQDRQSPERPGRQGLRERYRRRAQEGPAYGQEDDDSGRRPRLTAALLIRKFDVNGDDKLGERELTHMLRWFRRIRAQRQGDDGSAEPSAERRRLRRHGDEAGPTADRPARARNRRGAARPGAGFDR